MARLTRGSRTFLDGYERNYKLLEEQATLARQLVSSLLEDVMGHTVVSVESRPKSSVSLLRKLRRKNYRDPSRDLTDLVGVRIITFNMDQVNSVADLLGKSLRVHQVKSVDKRGALGPREFGYRSMHLVVTLGASLVRRLEYDQLRGMWFEIQVRSVLEHAWAEIEHLAVYKSGVEFPRQSLRRFAAVAGALEILDREFSSLRDEGDKLVDYFLGRFERGEDQDVPFDVARLLAYLERVRPRGRGWRRAKVEGAPFIVGLDSSCVEALQSVGLGTPRRLRKYLESYAYRGAEKDHAADKGVEPQVLSHLAVVMLAVNTRNPRVAKDFPELDLSLEGR